MQPTPAKRVHPPQLIVDEQSANPMITYAKCCYCVGDCCGVLRTWIPCIFCCCVEYPYQRVYQGNEGLFLRFGQYIKTALPGLHYVNPCTDKLIVVDKRITVLDLEPQIIMTKDNVTITIDASVYFRISSTRYSQFRIQNLTLSVKEITFSILKNVVGCYAFQELLERRKDIADDIEKQVEKYVENWGVKIDNIYIKDIKLSQDLVQALSSAASEQRIAQSKLITAMSDVQNAKMMREASEYLTSDVAMQIRYLETIQQMGSESSTKILFVPEEQDKQKLLHYITQGLLSS